MTLIRYLADLPDATVMSIANFKDTTNAFAASQVTGGSTVTASVDHPHNGVTGYKFAAGVSANVIARLPFAAANVDAAIEYYFWYSGTPPTLDERISSMRNSGGPGVLTSYAGAPDAGKVKLINAVGATIWTSAAALPSAGLYRIAIRAHADAAAGTARISYYAGDSTTAIETSAAFTGLNTGATAFTACDFGRIGTNAQAVTVYIDSIQMDDGRTTEIGVYPPATPSTVLINDFAGLRAAGYTGSLSDMRRQNFLALLSLSEPQYKSNNDLELQYWRSLSKTGSIQDARHQP